ncbi:hypothetical protein V6N12_072072 [Hibiscus sabdariffa]|uniref:Uncharacterized protein n=1 Tax=Hibiscus sabdariffa TaxID=183260 RepID=A0ABR2FM27_9ROSI
MTPEVNVLAAELKDASKLILIVLPAGEPFNNMCHWLRLRKSFKRIEFTNESLNEGGGPGGAGGRPTDVKICVVVGQENTK